MNTDERNQSIINLSDHYLGPRARLIQKGPSPAQGFLLLGAHTRARWQHTI